MNKKILALTLVVLAVVVTTGAYSMMRSPTQIETGGASDLFTYHSQVCVYKNDVLVAPCTHNLVTTAGKNAIRDYIGLTGGTGNAFKNLAVANCTNGVAAGDTDLCNGQRWTNCGMGISAPDAGFPVIDTGTGNFTTSKQWTSSCDNVYVNATGIYNSTAPGTLLAEATWTPVTTLQTNDKLNVTYTIWVT